MKQKPEQMPFDLGHRTGYHAEDFRVSACNREAFAWIGKWPGWDAPLLVLYGPPASGKTHLASVWQGRAHAVAAADAAQDTRAVLVEDVSDLIGDAEKERALFHLYNRLKEQGGHMLMTAQVPPKEWNFALPDLKSRVLAAPAVALQSPDDELMAVVLAKMFSDRQIFVPQEVIAFTLPRIERSFAAARALVDQVDKKALAEKRAVTVPLVRELLQAQAGQPLL